MGRRAILRRRAVECFRVILTFRDPSYVEFLISPDVLQFLAEKFGRVIASSLNELSTPYDFPTVPHVRVKISIRWHDKKEVEHLGHVINWYYAQFL